jgi:hypothetical protein
MMKLGVPVFLLSLTSASAQTIENFSTFFVERMDKECRVAQRAAPQNQKVTDSQIAQYCNCVARHAIETITMDEVFDLQRTAQRPRSMQNKLNALGETCAEVLSGKVRDEPTRRR